MQQLARFLKAQGRGDFKRSYQGWGKMVHVIISILLRNFGCFYTPLGFQAAEFGTLKELPAHISNTTI
jgi:hypothetical protein